MKCLPVWPAVFVSTTLCLPLVFADDANPEKPPAVTKLVESVRPSVVVVTFSGRDGKRLGLGTGFVVDAKGLIATNLHVLGEARPIQVETADGKVYDVKIIHASDKAMDLALVKINADNLKPLRLGDSDQLKQGHEVVAIGNPHGLERSVVRGIVSGRRTIDGRPMIQVAIPIEPGNSGGPLVDLQGRVQGIVTMKSLVTQNLGFAVPINALKTLLAKPNPIPIDRWLTIGTLDPEEWQILFGARWRQRAGRILVDTPGNGFGGRSLCLSKAPAPKLPFEIGVYVKLDDESGAAGLAFESDGGDKHFGFYPSGGKLRLTHFRGPDVFSWKILRDEPSNHYRPGEWNRLKVRLEQKKLLCYVNDHLVFTEEVDGLKGTRVGLVKFRTTKAEFKRFQVSKSIPPQSPPADLVKKIHQLVEDIDPRKPPQPKFVWQLLPHASDSVQVLRERARYLEKQAEALRQLAVEVHQQTVLQELAKVFGKKNEEDIDLCRAALLLAKLDNDEVDIDHYLKEVDRLARRIRSRFPKNATATQKREILNKALFEEHGFHGSRTNYYSPSNSYLNEVLDDREGLPITLSVLYLELARRLGLNMKGVPLPGHFVVRHEPKNEKWVLIDVFEGGKTLTREEAAQKVAATSGLELKEEHLQPATKKMIVVRMLHNLMGIAGDNRDALAMLRYLDAVLTVDPDAGNEHWMRAVLRYQTGRLQGAKADTDWLLEHQPDGIDLNRVRELRQFIDQALRSGQKQ
ncbi:MAG: hypothetical protein KatS3mg105_3403 [Gemmatales bacterium]|nr:MAG: hypothetical protein KatS3mg105_3403 [Gemmatales bacterium]